MFKVHLLIIVEIKSMVIVINDNDISFGLDYKSQLVKPTSNW